MAGRYKNYLTVRGLIICLLIVIILLFVFVKTKKEDFAAAGNITDKQIQDFLIILYDDSKKKMEDYNKYVAEVVVSFKFKSKEELQNIMERIRMLKNMADSTISEKTPDFNINSLNEAQKDKMKKAIDKLKKKNEEGKKHNLA